MKLFKKIMPVMLAVMLCFTALPTSVSAATKTVKAGETTTVSIAVKKGFGGQGTVVISGDSIGTITGVSGSGLGSFQSNGGKIAFSSDSEIKSGSINVTVKISDSAKAGQACTVSVSGYQYVDADDNMQGGSLGTQTLKIKAAAKPDDDKDDDKDDNKKPDKDDNKKPSTDSNKKPSTDSNKKPSTDSNKKPSTDSSKQPEVVDKTDYSELKKQIGIAEGLKKDGYTKESWDALQEALNVARNTVGCGDQDKVDAAAKALADAIANLEKMDYSKLEAAIDASNTLIASDELAELWNELFELLQNSQKLLTSDDQAAVDAAADEINALLDKIKALLGGEEEVVAAEPEGEYCNIPIHKVWPILFFISLAVNVLLVVLLVSLKNKKEQKRNRRTDNTPMVDYEIGDDDK